MLSRKERLAVFLERLKASERADTADSALKLLGNVLNATEDEFSGVPFNPQAWMDDGRMYPPTESNRRATSLPRARRYRSVRHNTLIGENGSIRIEQIDGTVILDKPGADGARVEGTLEQD